MKIKNNKINILNHKGMSLIEVVVAFAIVAVISVVIIVGFQTMGGIIKDSGDRSGIDQQLESQIATSGTPTNTTPGGISLSVGGTTFDISGEIREYQLSGSGTQQNFKVFIPNQPTP